MASTFTIRVKRVYEAPSARDGIRFLVDRLWPRGLTKAGARLDGWLKEIAPSDALRQWFGHDPARWQAFQKRYFAELDAKPDVWSGIVPRGWNRPVTLLYAARDAERNNAVALKLYLEQHLKG